jgi:hypothetical protein
MSTVQGTVHIRFNYVFNLTRCEWELKITTIVMYCFEFWTVGIRTFDYEFHKILVKYYFFLSVINCVITIINILLILFLQNLIRDTKLSQSEEVGRLREQFEEKVRELEKRYSTRYSSLRTGQSFSYLFVLQIFLGTYRRDERGSERRISLLRQAIFFTTSKVPFYLITTTTSLHWKWLFSWSLHQNWQRSLLQKSERQKECEKNIESLSFVWFSHFDYLWHKYLLRFWLFWC